jgi:hypothetical protein
VLKALGVVALVVLILVGALMPLRYTARMNLPAKGKPRSAPDPGAPDAGSEEPRGPG